MIHVIRARHAVWAPIMAGIVETIGRETPLYRAALRARLGRDPEGIKFAALAARLSPQDRARLLARLDMNCQGEHNGLA